jgi:hypothetical protein
MSKPHVLFAVSTFLVLALAAFGVTACGVSSNSDTSGAGAGLTVTTTAPGQAGSPTAAESITTTTAAPVTEATSSHASITHATAGEPATATTQTPTGSTLSEPPTGSTLSEPPKSPSTMVIVKPTNISLQPVNTWRLYQETDPFLYWDGSWEQYSNADASGGGYKSTFSGGRVSMTFTGQRISLLCPIGPKNGQIRLKLDYQTVGVVDLYANPYQFPGTVWTSDLLPNGAHVLQIEPTGTKNAMSGGFSWQFDAVKIYGKLLEYTQD